MVLLLLSRSVADEGSEAMAPCGGGEGAAVRVGDDAEEEGSRATATSSSAAECDAVPAVAVAALGLSWLRVRRAGVSERREVVVVVMVKGKEGKNGKRGWTLGR